MPILLKAYHLVVSKQTLKQKYHKGIKQFKIDFNFKEHQFNQEDDELISICSLIESKFDFNLLLDRGLEAEYKDGEIINSDDFAMVNPDGNFLWFSGFIETNSVYLFAENTNNDQYTLVDYISEEFTLREFTLFKEYSEFPILTINKKSLPVLLNEAKNFWVLIERKFKADFKEQKAHMDSFMDYLKIHSKEQIVSENRSICYLPNLEDFPDYVFRDERDLFIPDLFYYENRTKCEEALSLLKDAKDVYNIDEENLCAFVGQFEPLYSKLFDDWNFKAFNEFRSTYFFALDWIEYYRLNVEVKAALNALNPNCEADIRDWLSDYNRLYYCNSIFWDITFEVIDEVNHFYTVYSDYTVYIQGEAITNCLEFGKKYVYYSRQ